MLLLAFVVCSRFALCSSLLRFIVLLLFLLNSLKKLFFFLIAKFFIAILFFCYILRLFFFLSLFLLPVLRQAGGEPAPGQPGNGFCALAQKHCAPRRVPGRARRSAPRSAPLSGRNKCHVIGALPPGAAKVPLGPAQGAAAARVNYI